MQVFVPTTDFESTAECLDSIRLNKQLVECLQILNVIHNVPKPDGSQRKGWTNHPAVLQWKPWPGALARYADACANELERRGRVTATLRASLAAFSREGSLPAWWGDPQVHSTHRSRLLQKHPDHYNRFNWPESSDPDLATHQYWWAIPKNGTYSLERRGRPIKTSPTSS